MTIKVSKPAKGLREAIAEVIGRGASVINGMTKGDAQDELEVSRKNWIINGDHQVNQRGLLPVTGITNVTYEATDRWQTLINGATGNASLSNGWLRAEATSAASNGRIGFRQRVEDHEPFKGETVTLSVQVKSNSSNARLGFHDGSTFVAMDSHSGSGDEETLSITVGLSSSITDVQIQVRIMDSVGGNLAYSSGDYIEFTNVKLEIGDTATPFESRSYAEELRDCRRYWWQPDLSGSTISRVSVTGYMKNTTTAFIFIDNEFHDIADEISYANLAIYDGTTIYPVTGLTVNANSIASITQLNATVSSGPAAGTPIQLLSNNSTSGKLGVGNEL